MSTEIELKYLVLNEKESNGTALIDENLSENVSTKICNLLNKELISFDHQIKQLGNCYFDTPELGLRKLDMGLRIRNDNNRLEQTIKTAGVVIGGLHQRPEYNVEVEQEFPELTLFPENIWPEQQLVQQLQSQLIPLFNTDFTRQIWLVNFESSVVEIAFDQGEITSADESIAICEIELEIISGSTSDLFLLASLLFNTLKLRPGMESKAKRGYQLFSNKPKKIKSLDFEITNYPTSKKQAEQYISSGAGFVHGVATYLQVLQLAIEQYIHSPQLNKLADVVKALRLLRHGFWLFESQLTASCIEIRKDLSHFMQLFAWVENAIYLQELMNKTGNYRKKLEYSEQLITQLKLEKRRFPDVEMIVELLHSERFNCLQLKLLKLAVNHSPAETVKSNEEISLASFAKEKLSFSLTNVIDIMPKKSIIDAEQALPLRKLLRRSLLTGYWLGSLFDREKRQQFRMPWLDIEQGLSELQSLWIIKQQLEKLAQPADKIVKWQHNKVDNLLLALEHSKQVALSKKVYWHA